jgi:ComF family protein
MFNPLLNFFLPHTCVLCEKLSDREIDLCDRCEQQLPWIKYSCTQCGLPLNINKNIKNKAALCGYCLSRKFIFDRTVVPFIYEGNIIPMITRLKFYDQLVYAKLLSQLLLKYLEAKQAVEIIIPIPLHTTRLQKRGFNQSLEIARELSKALQLPIDNQSCVRIKPTMPQSELSGVERGVNLQEAFAVREKLNYAKVALLDDVVTTGHTVFECAKMLKQAGVQSIELWCCARSKWPFK